MKRSKQYRRGLFYFQDAIWAKGEILAFAGSVREASVMIYGDRYQKNFLYRILEDNGGMTFEDAKLFCKRVGLCFNDAFVPGYVLNPYDFNDFPRGIKFVSADRYYPKDYDGLAVRITKVFESLNKASSEIFGGRYSVCYIRNVFSWKYGFNRENAEMIAKALDASVNELFEDADASAERWGGQVSRKIVK